MRTKAGIILLGQGEGIMKTKARIILLGLVMAIVFCYANSGRADSNFATGAGAQSAAVNLDFQIVIPRFIYFRVGTVGIVDTINFAPTATDVATPAAVTAGTGGDAGGGAVNVDVVSNGGNITITETNNGGGSGLGDGGVVNYISYAQIQTGSGAIPAPILSNGPVGNTSVIVSGDVTDLSDVWTYTYINPPTPPAAGTYGTAANGGQVTYTAAIP